jgi:restriction system protein
LVGAAISAWKKRERKALIRDVVQSAAADVLDGMSWQQFERLVGEAFRLQGYSVIETGGGGADGGVDLILTKGSEKFLVQCKQWKAFKVGVDVVRELYGVMAAKGAAGGYIVTSGRFTAEATNFASGRNVQLIDGPQLHALIGHVRGGQSAYPGARRGTTQEPTTEQTAQNPNCPICSQAMVKRVAKRSPNAGNVFWGCSSYPSCRGTRQLSP